MVETTCNKTAFSQKTISVLGAGWVRELELWSLLSGLAGGCPWPDFLLANVDLSWAAVELVPLQIRDAEKPVCCRGAELYDWVAATYSFYSPLPSTRSLCSM